MGAESWKDPDNDGLDEWRPKEEDASGAPGYMLPPASGLFPKYLRTALCPKCEAMNRERAKGNPPLLEIQSTASFNSQTRLIWCALHLETFFDDFRRYVDRFPVQPDSPDTDG